MSQSPSQDIDDHHPNFPLIGMRECVGHVVPVDFFVFILRIGLALCSGGARGSRGIGAGTEMSSVCNRSYLDPW
jgi:hypothetical protein